MGSKTEICNMALGHVGVGREISNVDSERSEEALACRRFFDQARDETLREYAWPFATKLANLGLIVQNPNTEWGYSYRYPSDCLEFRRILSGKRTDTPDSRVPYKIGQDDQGQIIYTDIPSAQCEYTTQITAIERFPADFRAALSLLLATYIAPRVTGGDPFKLGDRAMRLYQFKLTRAEVAAGNEEQPDRTPEAESIRARD